MKRESFLILLSFATIYIVWGSTYLASAFVIKEIEAYRLCAWRFLLASAIALSVWGLGRKRWRPDRMEIRNAVIAGALMLGVGTGAAIWSLNYLDSGFSALIISASPLIIVLMIWIYKKQRPSVQTLSGIFLGISGMVILVLQKEMVPSINHYLGILAIFFSMLAWGSGSLFVAEANLPRDPLLNIGIQLLVGGCTAFVISLLLSESPVNLSGLSMKACLSMAFLVLFGSLGAFTAFNYLLKKVSAEKVVTNTYVNPLIAMLLGYLYNDEIITLQSILAAVIMLFGVFLINTRRRA